VEPSFEAHRPSPTCPKEERGEVRNPVNLLQSGPSPLVRFRFRSQRRFAGAVVPSLGQTCPPSFSTNLIACPRRSSARLAPAGRNTRKKHDAIPDEPTRHGLPPRDSVTMSNFCTMHSPNLSATAKFAPHSNGMWLFRANPSSLRFGFEPDRCTQCVGGSCGSWRSARSARSSVVWRGCGSRASRS